MLKAGTKSLNVLHMSTWNEVCGIADYTRDMINALGSYGVVNTVHPIDRRRRKYMLRREIKKDLIEFCKKAQAADIIHIQHEFAFFNDSNVKHSIDDFRKLLKKLKRTKKPVAITFHTEIDFFDANLYRFIGSRSLKELLNIVLRHYWKNRISRFFNKRSRFHAIVHTKQTKLKLVESGFYPDKIMIMPLGILPRSSLVHTDKNCAKQQLNYSEDIILLSTFGFISEHKGLEFAIRALEMLPEQYHLAIVGGPHPEATGSVLDKLLKLIHQKPALQQRIRITGYVDAKTRDLYQAATDICLATYKGNMSGSAGIGWALSSGRPTIASRISTFNEINQAANCFLMCSQKSVFELVWQINYLTTNPDLQAQLVKNALKYAEENQWSKIVLKLIIHYEKYLGSIRDYTVTLPNNVSYTMTVESAATDPVSQECKTGKAYQEDAVELMLKLVKHGSKVLDIGAHIGTFSLAAAANGCQVIAVEASPLHAELIKLSVQTNQFHQLHVVNAAINDTDDIVEFEINGPWGCVTKSGEVISTDNLKIKVNALPVRMLLKNMNWEQIDFIKMDVEGYEMAALSGMLELLQQADAPPIFYESNGPQLERYGHSPQALKKCLENLGYQNYLFDRGRLAPVKAEDFQAYPCVDYLAIKKAPASIAHYFRTPLSEDEIIERILAICAHPLAIQRAIMAKGLGKADNWIRQHSKIIAALQQLRTDEDNEVREHAAWSGA